MEIVIKNNLLRLLSPRFMHLVPRLDAATVMREGGKYNLESPGYGRIGQVELIKVWERPLYDLRNAETMLSLGLDCRIAIEALKAERLSNLAPIQCGIFRFLRRNDSAIKAILDAELPKAGIHITHQPSLL